MVLAGILFAAGAMVFWGFGDFYIQKSTRETSIWRTLFFNDLLAVVLIFPFVKNEIQPILSIDSNFWLLTAAGLSILVAAVLIFKSYKEGKLAIVDPVLSLEMPLTVFLGIFLWKESLTLVQGLLVGLVFLGILLAITKHYSHLHYHKRIFEKGVLFALFGAIVMGLTNFLVGVSSQETSALFTIWYISVIMLIFSTTYLLFSGEYRKLLSDLKSHGRVVVAQSTFDNVAWVSYAYSMTMIPISIATTISESYVALAVLLGVFVNREKIKPHQILGVIIAILGVILLGVITS